MHTPDSTQLSIISRIISLCNTLLLSLCPVNSSLLGLPGHWALSQLRASAGLYLVSTLHCILSTLSREKVRAIVEPTSFVLHLSVITDLCSLIYCVLRMVVSCILFVACFCCHFRWEGKSCSCKSIYYRSTGHCVFIMLFLFYYRLSFLNG